jgi:ankyrin repeat protein
MDLPPLSHQALFAAVRSADAAAVCALLADAESSGTSLAALAAAQTDAGETALYVAVEAGSEEVVRLLLPLYDLEAATVRSRLGLNAFHVAAKQGHTGELSPLPPVPFDPFSLVPRGPIDVLLLVN